VCDVIKSKAVLSGDIVHSFRDASIRLQLQLLLMLRCIIVSEQPVLFSSFDSSWTTKSDDS
jgi:hypothetical protein